jgi:uncharacterized membrane protein HdeD (DUF308 family)
MTDESVTTPAEAVKKGGGRLVIFGILMLVFGLLSVAAPLLTGMSISMLVGIIMLMAGMTRMIWAFKAPSIGKGILCFLLGGLTFVAGGLMLARPLFAVMSLTILLVAYFMVDGLSEILSAFEARPARGWGWMLLGGVVSLLLGLMIWRQFPLSGAWAIGVLVGVHLILAGWAMIGLGAVARGAAADAAPEA